MKLHLFKKVWFAKNEWWFLSADLNFHSTYQISVEPIFSMHFYLWNWYFFFKYGTISLENNNLFIHMALLYNSINFWNQEYLENVYIFELELFQIIIFRNKSEVSKSIYLNLNTLYQIMDSYFNKKSQDRFSFNVLIPVRLAWSKKQKNNGFMLWPNHLGVLARVHGTPEYILGVP